MMPRLTLWLAQLNPTVGALDANLDKIRAARAQAGGADLVLTPEMSLVGYPPEDLVRKPAFIDAVSVRVEALAADTAKGGPAVLAGGLRRSGDLLYNTMFLLANGRIEAFYDKHELPNYGVFDEKRVFDSAPPGAPIEFQGVRLGVMICEDMWLPTMARRHCAQGADMLLVPTASPFQTLKFHDRMRHACARVDECGLPLIFCNQVGGQDEIVFDGTSFVLNPDRSFARRLPAWTEAGGPVVLEQTNEGWRAEVGDVEPVPEGPEEVYQALMLGLRDYVGKNGFPGVILGLSGGIDSALTAAVAVDALGPDKVHCVMMPSRYTSSESLEDAAGCAKALGCRLDEIAIAPGVAAFEEMLRPLFDGRDPDLTEENIQARIRGVLLMGLSNKFGHMLLTTGNKSEVSVGYATLYGDMAGGYSVLKDVYKTMVFRLARWRNASRPRGAAGPEGSVIPERIITKPPTAELRADQRDEDSLPPYDLLDAILEGLVDEELGGEDLVQRGFDRQTVARVEHLLYVSEHKRRQAAPGVKITRRNFGRDRRYPITNAFRTARAGD
ncbi:MAG: NAD+ synthase [Rhodothalassiaceae bacterium]